MTAERRRAPSLFERITTGVGRLTHMDDGHEETGSSSAGSTGGFHGGLRAERAPDAPSQGQLNIDSPSAPRAKNEDDLDIPAFLRRQAN